MAGLFELFQRFDLERVAQANDATVDHPRGDPAMAAHCLKGAKAQAPVSYTHLTLPTKA